MRYVLRRSPDVPSRSVRVCAVIIMTSNGLELLDRQVACSVVNMLVFMSHVTCVLGSFSRPCLLFAVCVVDMIYYNLVCKTLQVFCAIYFSVGYEALRL